MEQRESESLQKEVSPLGKGMMSLRLGCLTILMGGASESPPGSRSATRLWYSNQPQSIRRPRTSKKTGGVSLPMTQTLPQGFTTSTTEAEFKIAFTSSLYKPFSSCSTSSSGESFPQVDCSSDIIIFSDKLADALDDPGDEPSDFRLPSATSPDSVLFG